MPVPPKIQNAPSLNLGLELYFNAFFDLTNSRQLGMSYGPIPWNAVQQYCDHLNLEAEQTDDMHHHINKMDFAWLNYQNKKSKKT